MYIIFFSLETSTYAHRYNTGYDLKHGATYMNTLIIYNNVCTVKLVYGMFSERPAQKCVLKAGKRLTCAEIKSKTYLKTLLKFMDVD